MRELARQQTQRRPSEGAMPKRANPGQPQRQERRYSEQETGRRLEGRSPNRPAPRRRAEGYSSDRPAPRRRIEGRSPDRPEARRVRRTSDSRQPERMRAEKRVRIRKRQIRRRRAARLLKGIAAAAILVFLLPKAAGFASALGKGIFSLFASPSASVENGTAADGNLTAGSIPAGQAPVLPQGGVDAQILEHLRETWKDNPEAAPILEHPEEYPDALLELLSKRPETLSFVLHYPSQKNEKQTIDLSGETTQGTLPLLYQWDERWGYGRYGDSIVALSGCGPTCLSMVLIGLTGDVSLHPQAVAVFSEENGYRTEGGTAWDLMTLGAAKLGITGEELPLDEGRMTEALRQGHPIICSMRPGDFTDTGHFIVLVGYEDGAFLVHDPNSVENSRASWTYEQIHGQIKNLWAYSL